MKNTFIMSVVGPDSIGIMKSLAEVTRKAGGEWLTSKIIKLAGQFSAVMKVTIDKDLEDNLNAELTKKFPDLHFFYSPVVEVGSGATELVNLEVDCKDRPGLTKDISNILSNLNINVENMEFNRCHVSSIGEAVFTAKLSINVPEGTSSEAIAEEIESLSNDVRVNVI